MTLLRNKVIVTRPLQQTQKLVALLESAGFEPLVFPPLQIEPIFPKKIPSIPFPDKIIFTSANSVQFGFESIRDTQYLAVGETTAYSLKAEGIDFVLYPAKKPGSEALLELSALKNVRGEQIRIVCGENSKSLLKTTLQQRGALVEVFEVYRRIPNPIDPEKLLKAWEVDEVHSIVCTSLAILQSFMNILGQKGAIYLQSTPLIVVSQAARDFAQACGLKNVHLAESPKDEILVKTIQALEAE